MRVRSTCLSKTAKSPALSESHRGKHPATPVLFSGIRLHYSQRTKSWCGGLRGQLNDQSVSPTVFRAREMLNLPLEFRIELRWQDSCHDRECHLSDSHCRAWVGTQVLHPTRSVVLGNHIEAAVVVREPDLDFARHARFTAAGDQVQVLLALEATGL
jgi:hypothetical protein